MKTLCRKFNVGCSGYYYSQWKNSFYPQGLSTSEWLQHYSSVFDSVELNGTFYRVPKLSDLENYAKQTPDNFTFSVKISRYITHVLKLENCEEKIQQFCNLIHAGLGDKLENILFQLPPSFQYSEENMERVLRSIPGTPNYAVEFRHISWRNPEIIEQLRKHGCSFCNSDYPGLDHSFIQTSKRFYARFHGSPELFKSSYSQEDLKKFSESLPNTCGSFYIYFNNTYYDAAFRNAIELLTLLGEPRPEWHGQLEESL